MKKTIDQTSNKILVLLLFLVFLSMQGLGQMISRETADYPQGTIFNSCPGSGCEITLPALKLNESKIYTIPLLVTSPDNVYISAITGTCSEVLGSYSLTNSVNEITAEVTSKCSSGNSTLSFILNVEKSGNVPDYQQFHIPIVRDVAKIALVLDISGSMSLEVQGTTETRIDELKYAVNQLLPKLELFKQEGDSLALTYFSSNIIQPEVTYFPENFILIDDSDADFYNWSSSIVYLDLDPRVPLQMTALGEGLIDAKAKLDLDNSKDVRRMVFLFTDGLQNYGNQLKPDGLTFYGSTDSLNNYSVDPKDSIYYFPVATWAAGDQPELLQNIVDANRGEVLFVTPHSPLNSWFNNQLVNMLDNGSPQLVLEKSADFLNREANYSFSLNENINILAIELTGNLDIKTRIFKDGMDVTSFATLKKGDKSYLLSFKFPLDGNTAINSGGDWEVKLTGSSKETYSLSVIADDHFTDYECSLNNSTFTVGDTIKFNTKLSYRGNAVSLAGNTVQIILLKPGDDLGHLLSIYETPDVDQLRDVDTELAGKFNELMANDSSFYNALLPKEQIIDLTDDGNGEFSGYFDKTDLAGIYNVIFLINGEIPGNGKLQRTKTVSAIFVFGQAEEEEPEIVDVPIPNQYSKYITFRIRPKNKFGKYMGPGFASKINVSVNKKPLALLRAKSQISTHKEVELKTEPFIDRIEDKMDGSYLIYIANVSADDNPDIRINVRGESIYEGKLKPIPFWFYIVAFVIVLLLLLIKKSKTNRKLYKVLMWILLLVCAVIFLLHKLGILYIF